MRLSILLLASCILTAGCQTPRPTTAPQREPVELASFGNYDRFPEEVAGFRRGKVIEFESPLREYAIGYNIFEEKLQSAVTLYFYPADQDKPTQAKLEVDGILRAHPGAKVRSQRTARLVQSRESHEAQITSFEYEQVFAGKRQRVWSQLILVFIGDRTFKVRSTAPVEQEAFASEKLLTLLERVQWAR